jgi:hypothetical protein
MENKLRWCFGLKGGLRVAEPKRKACEIHMEEANVLGSHWKKASEASLDSFI